MLLLLLLLLLLADVDAFVGMPRSGYIRRVVHGEGERDGRSTEHGPEPGLLQRCLRGVPRAPLGRPQGETENWHGTPSYHLPFVVPDERCFCNWYVVEQ